jgi:hypothetical protein
MLRKEGSVRVRGLIFGGVGAVAGCTWLLAPTVAGSGMPTRIEVRQVEMGMVLGRPGVKVRLTLQSGQAVEFKTGDSTETEATIRMAEVFLSGQGRLYAELDGNAVQSIQVAGPVARIAQ